MDYCRVAQCVIGVFCRVAACDVATASHTDVARGSGGVGPPAEGSDRVAAEVERCDGSSVVEGPLFCRCVLSSPPKDLIADEVQRLVEQCQGSFPWPWDCLISQTPLRNGTLVACLPQHCALIRSDRFPRSQADYHCCVDLLLWLLPNCTWCMQCMQRM